MTLPQDKLDQVGKQLKLLSHWLQEQMPSLFLQGLSDDTLVILCLHLIGFPHQDGLSHLHTKEGNFVFSTNSPSILAELLEHYQGRPIQSFRLFTSKDPFPLGGSLIPLCITRVCFDADDVNKELITDAQFEEMTLGEVVPEGLKIPQFWQCLSKQEVEAALSVFHRAECDEHCQYEILPQEVEEELQIVLAWQSIDQRSLFLSSFIKMVQRYQSSFLDINALFIEDADSTLLLFFTLRIKEFSIKNFLQELLTLKYFLGVNRIEKTFVSSGLLTGNEGNLVKAMSSFVHQTLVPFDAIRYSFSCVERTLCRYPELLVSLVRAFEYKFHPEKQQHFQSAELLRTFREQTEKINTGQELYDIQHKAILHQAGHFLEYCLKNNFYRRDKSAFCFRLDPTFLSQMSQDLSDKFPEFPFAIYFVKGMHFLGFHIRFKDLARGGLRTVIPRNSEAMFLERNNIFSECYHLAYTQQKKNKDIPEGGAKGVIFLEEVPSSKERLKRLYTAQRAYIENLLTLVNCELDGTLKADDVVDYWKKPEYLYLGPDENMHNTMIDWIAQYSVKQGYKPGKAFISSKTDLGINHKEFGVTSFGVNVYMTEILYFMGIDPNQDAFTLKMTGGPDGDVAGNQMLNLYRYYPNTAKLLTTIDISGTIFDPAGLDLKEIQTLFLAQKPICDYPQDKLSPGGFLLDTRTKEESGPRKDKTRCYKNIGGKLVEEWIPLHEVNHLLRYTVHKTQADLFIPGGGRPKTLHETNVPDFLQEDGTPTARAIIEGANLYLTPPARKILESLGVLIIKDSSANKGGVICSSFEVQTNLCLTPEEFIKEKPFLVEEILDVIAKKAQDEALFLLQTHKATSRPMTEISDELSQKLNECIDAILLCLEGVDLPQNPSYPLNCVLLDYCLPTLQKEYIDRILSEIPDIHKKAIIACHLASKIIYNKQILPKEKILHLNDLLVWTHEYFSL